MTRNAAQKTESADLGSRKSPYMFWTDNMPVVTETRAGSSGDASRLSMARNGAIRHTPSGGLRRLNGHPLSEFRMLLLRKSEGIQVTRRLRREKYVAFAKNNTRGISSSMKKGAINRQWSEYAQTAHGLSKVPPD
jgi:hypothetical protein